MTQVTLYAGALDGGPKCRMSSLGNCHAQWHCARNVHVNFTMVPSHMPHLRSTLSNLFSLVARLYVACRFSKMVMSLCRI